LSARYFIFDNDGQPTNLRSSATVKLLQWDRRCLENYLIDLDILTQLLKDPDIVKDPLPNQGEVSKLVRELAMSQIDEFVARRVYSNYQFDDCGIRGNEIHSKNLESIADILVQRLIKVSGQLTPLSNSEWKNTFLQQCQEIKTQQVLVWEARWPEFCDGKALFSDLFRQRGFKMSLIKFKKRIMLGMRSGPSAGWRSIESLVKQLIQR
jgi:hypothetical protein